MIWLRSKSTNKKLGEIPMKHENQETKQEQVTANYQLKSEAVEQLVEAMHDEAPQYSQEELDRYRTKRKIAIPTWLKIS